MLCGGHHGCVVLLALSNSLLITLCTPSCFPARLSSTHIERLICTLLALQGGLINDTKSLRSALMPMRMNLMCRG